jgi:DNA-binding GntR family transcriptional regulator
LSDKVSGKRGLCQHRQTPADVPIRVSATPPATTDTVQRLRTLMASGQLAAGQALIEQELSQRLAVSRPTVREALRELEAEGLACRSRARGLAVRRLTRRDVEELYDIREALEALAARRAAERLAAAPAAQRQVFEEQRRLWVQAAASGTLTAFSQANRLLHALILEAAHNSHLPRLLDRTLLDLFAAQLRGWLAPATVLQSAQEHLGVIDALLAGEGAAAERAMRRHVQSSARAILALPDEAF